MVDGLNGCASAKGTQRDVAKKAINAKFMRLCTDGVSDTVLANILGKSVARAGGVMVCVENAESVLLLGLLQLHLEELHEPRIRIGSRRQVIGQQGSVHFG